MKKIISLLLALAVALTMCVIPAFADVTNADSATVVYVVDEAQDGETVEGLVAGEYFVPDRMPIAETPAGKYFAGWQDANGNWAGVDGFLLTAGENTLTAVYKDYVYNTVSTSGYVYSNEDVFAYASYDSNGENFMNYVDGNGSYLNFETVDLNGEEVLCIKNGNTWGSRANFLIPNSDGSAMVVEPGESYNITMTYKVPNYVEEIYLLFAEGLGFDNSGSFVDTRVEINTPFQGVAQSVASFTSTTDPNF
ncbi:MAG: hypothetical protein IKU89_04705, partial [Oscillospiraceae bacterium]|nr:hypothetical protein [Oscillospiraceae bacterium]